jgi:hypothetical protein
LPVTNICSSSFWRSEPTHYQSFDTITVINDNLDTEDTDTESESESEIDGEEEMHDDNYYNGTISRHLPLSRVQFQTTTEWQYYDQALHEGQDCVICPTHLSAILIADSAFETYLLHSSNPYLLSPSQQTSPEQSEIVEVRMHGFLMFLVITCMLVKLNQSTSITSTKRSTFFALRVILTLSYRW